MENTKKTFDINGHDVTITNLSVEDYREGRDIPPLSHTFVIINLEVDGAAYELVLFPSEHDNLEFALTEDDAHESVNGCSILELIEFEDLGELVEVAQSVFDDFLKNDVVNSAQVPLEKIKKGFVMDCHVASCNSEFICNGDGYLTIENIEHWRKIRRYRLDADLVDALEEIKEEYEDEARTREVLNYFSV